MNSHEQVVAAIAKKLADEGKLIEAGFEVLNQLIIPSGAPQAQVDDMRLAYMAGAQHLWASMMTSLDPGEDETSADLVRMTNIQAELDTWQQSVKLRFSESVGGEQ